MCLKTPSCTSAGVPTEVASVIRGKLASLGPIELRITIPGRSYIFEAFFSRALLDSVGCERGVPRWRNERAQPEHVGNILPNVNKVLGRAHFDRQVCLRFPFRNVFPVKRLCEAVKPASEEQCEVCSLHSWLSRIVSGSGADL